MPKLTANQQAYALISLYESEFEAKYRERPRLNRHRDKWGFQDMVEDLGYGEAQEVIKYYFEMKFDVQRHPIQTLFRNYDRFAEIRRERAEDQERIKRLAKETEKRVKEFEAKNGND